MLTDSRCHDCHRARMRQADRDTYRRNGPRDRPERQLQRGAWQRLSKRARALQPFCSDCGSTSDLQADHTPQAWARVLSGKAIRLQDVQVVCGECNRQRGEAQPGSVRYEEWEKSNGTRRVHGRD